MLRNRPESTVRGLAAISAAALLLLAAVTTGAAERKAATTIRWQPDLQTAHDLSVRTNKPMLLVFGAEWCHYCKKLERGTLINPQIVRYVNANFVAVHVDADEQAQVVEILGVTGLPCSVVLSPEADLLGRIRGYKQPEDLYKELSLARRKFLELQAEREEGYAAVDSSTQQ